MTRMPPLLQRNGQFARTYTPAALGLPTAQVRIVTCLDHRVWCLIRQGWISYRWDGRPARRP